MVERKTEPQVTIDHDEIRRWAEARGARPAAVKGVKGREPGIIGLILGYTGNGKLEHISWDEWFKKFEEANLAFVYRERTSSGERSNFKNFVARESVNLGTSNTKEAMLRRRRKQAGEGAANGERRYMAGAVDGGSSRTDGARQKRSRPKRTGRSRASNGRAASGSGGRGDAR